jgi:hypothetical protein
MLDTSTQAALTFRTAAERVDELVLDAVLADYLRAATVKSLAGSPRNQLLEVLQGAHTQ